MELAKIQVSKVNAIITLFSNIQSKEKIIKECQSYFITHDYYRDETNNILFHDRLNMAKNLIG
ncbi:hypothetical protein GGF32_006360, partial [Allomyces javanicus]